MVFALVSTFLLGFLLYIYFLSKGKQPKFWKKHGIQEIDSSKAATNLEILLGLKSITHRDDYAYKAMGNSAFCGMLENPVPVILIKDLDLVKKVMIKDFDHFVDRRDFFEVTEKSILKKMVGFLRGDEWKSVRSSISPTFTTGKIRRMMEHFNGVSLEWSDVLMKRAQSNQGGSVEIDILREVNLYATEVIGSAVFGIKPGVIKNPKSIFADMAYRLTYIGFWESIKFSLNPRYPKLFSLLQIDVFDTTAVSFFQDIMKQSLEARRKEGTNQTKNDFQQLLLEAQKGQLKAVGSDELSKFEEDAALKPSENSKAQFLTDELIEAQGVVFFIAGFTGTTTLITFAAYALALHQDCQEKLRCEVSQVVKEDGSLDYDELGHLTYLDQVISEVFRFFSLVTRLERECFKDYRDDESGLYVPKGGVVVVPVNAIHHDPKYFANPEIFDPEHFSPEQKRNRNPYTFLSFGIGPRNCVGMRFALIEAKAAIAHLVHRFKIEPTKTTPIPLQGKIVGTQIVPPKHLELKLTPLNV